MTKQDFHKERIYKLSILKNVRIIVVLAVFVVFLILSFALLLFPFLGHINDWDNFSHSICLSISTQKRTSGRTDGRVYYGWNYLYQFL